MLPSLTRRQAGFTVAELLISLTLVSVLMVALVDSLQGFSSQLAEVVDAEADARTQESLALMTRAVRHAWLVDVPAEDTLETTDPFGGITGFWRSNDALRVSRPSGTEGTLVQGLSDFDVATASVQRLRPDSDLVLSAEWWSVGVESWEALPIVLEEGLPLTLGFTLPSEAPGDVTVVEGVQELAVAATLDTVSVPLTFVEPVEDVALSEDAGDDAGDDASEDASGDDDGGKGKGKSKGKGATKVTICHSPPGNPDNAFSITVGEPSLSAHLAHGDTEGACGPSEPLADPDDSELVVALYEGLAPGDGRPYGEALATIRFPVTSLSGGSYSWVSASSLGPDWSVVCHYPPGEGADYHTLAVHADELADHLAHGDVVGSCSDGGVVDETPVLVYGVPDAATGLDLVSLGALIEPGRAYTVQLSLDGRGTVLLRAGSEPAATLTDVGGDRAASGSYRTLPFRVARSLSGTVTYTQTEAIDVVSVVTLGLTTEEGAILSQSASVLSQRAVENPWLGAVPGELPELELAGQ